MTSRNIVRLFWTTLLVGGVTTAIVGFIVRWDQMQSYVVDLQFGEILSAVVWFIVMGFLFSVISQMGFFAYLTIHRFGLGIFKSASLWNAVQVVLILFALFDLVYLRYDAFAKTGDSFVPYMLPALFLLLVGFIVAWIKMKETNRQAFIPALFFMIVVTIVEWVPVLRENSKHWLYLMVTALIFCNAYQILMLHKLNARSEQERQEKIKQRAVGAPQKKITKKPSI